MKLLCKGLALAGLMGLLGCCGGDQCAQALAPDIIWSRTEVVANEEDLILAVMPAAEQRTSTGVVGVVLIERADHDVRVDDQPHRCWSSASRRAR